MEGSAERKYPPNISELPGEVRASSKASQEGSLGRYTASFGLSVAITSIFSALLVVVKELNESTVLDWMKHVTPHHWITHGVINLIVFAAVGFALARANGGKGLKLSPKTLTQLIVGAVAIGCITISGFYLLMQ